MRARIGVRGLGDADRFARGEGGLAHEVDEEGVLGREVQIEGTRADVGRGRDVRDLGAMKALRREQALRRPQQLAPGLGAATVLPTRIGEAGDGRCTSRHGLCECLFRTEFRFSFKGKVP